MTFLRNAAAALLIAALPLTVNAAAIDRIDIGDSYYLEGVFYDELVYVLRVDYPSNTVKIRYAENSQVAWVNPSRLISAAESAGNDIGRGVIGAAIIYCMFAPEECS